MDPQIFIQWAGNRHTTDRTLMGPATIHFYGLASTLRESGKAAKLRSVGNLRWLITPKIAENRTIVVVFPAIFPHANRASW
jgi:hypothetical protein